MHRLIHWIQGVWFRFGAAIDADVELYVRLEDYYHTPDPDDPFSPF